MLKLNHSRAVALILAISLAVRWLLIFQGGQYFFSDEQRYNTSRTFVELTFGGNPSEAFTQLFTAPEHLGFKIIGIVPAVLELLTRESLILPALFFSLFSVLNLFLIYKISQQTGAHETKSLRTLIIAASSMSLLYFSRHLVPYDVAMTFGLLAIYTALSEKPTVKTSLLCGATAFACFITYNGYWSLAGLAMLIHTFRINLNLKEIFRKALLTSIGFILPALFLILLAALTETDLLNEYRVFASTVSQGQFDEGWSLSFEYFWHAEHWLFIILVLLSIYVVYISRWKDKSINLWAGSVIFIYLCLLIPSVFLNSFVVYGRLARQMMPFLILLSASGFARAEEMLPRGKTLASTLLVLVVILAAWNYKASFDLSYPREFARQAQAQFSDFEFSEKRHAFGAPTLCQNNSYVIEYAKHFVVPPEPNPPIQGEVLFSALHPDNFLPYQYEGYTYEERQRLRELQIEMRFYKADAGFMSETNPVWKTIKSCLVNEN